MKQGGRFTPTPAQLAVVALLRTADRVQTFLAKVIEPQGITGQQYNVLRILRGAGPEGLPMLSIADRMIERTPGITRMIDRLEARKLVVRERRAGDRRCIHSRITPKGLAILKRLDRPVEEATRRTVAALKTHELQQVVLLLERIRMAREEPCGTSPAHGPHATPRNHNPR